MSSRRACVTALVLIALTAVPLSAASDVYRSSQWALDVIGAPTAWSRGTGAGTTIAVIDTGVDLVHEDLQAHLLTGRNFVEGSGPPADDFGHGTHVSGIAGAVTGNGRGIAGAAPDVRILPVRVLARDPQNENQAVGDLNDVAAGIRWAADQGAHVINLSLGQDVILTAVNGQTFNDAVEYAWQKGSVPVIAAGNQHFVSSNYGSLHALVVVATDRDDGIASYSNESGPPLLGARWGISAPGGDTGNAADQIISTFWASGSGGNRYAYRIGTSMAAPFVSAGAAILRSLGLTQQQTVDRLLATAKDLGSAGRDSQFGAGRLDLARATEGLGSGTVVSAPASSAPAAAGTSSGTTTTRSGTARPKATESAPSSSAAETSAETYVAAAPAAVESPSTVAAPAPPATARSPIRALAGAGIIAAVAVGGLALRRISR